MAKLNRRERRKQEAQGRKGQDHKAQAKSPGQEAQAQAKAQAQTVKDQEAKDQTKAGLTVDRNISTGQVKVTDSQGKAVPTKDDQARIDKVKASRVKAQELTRQAREAQRQAKLDLDELNGSGSSALRTLLQDITTRIKDQEAKTEALRDDLKAELVTLNDLYAEFKTLTGLDKGGKGGGGKAKTSKPNGNGRFTATVKAKGDQLKVLVTHIKSKALFESSLYPANGTVRADDWLALRHRFVAFFEAPDHKAPADKALPARDYNLILRAYLSNLKGKIEAVKPII